MTEAETPDSAQAVLTRRPAGPAGPKPTPALVRVAAGTAAAVALAVLLVVDAQWRAGFLYAACGTALVALVMAELADLAHALGMPARRRTLVWAGAGVFVLHWAGLAAPGAMPPPWAAAGALAALAVMGVLAARVVHGPMDGAFQEAAALAMGLLYVAVPLTFLTAVRMRWGVAGLVLVLLATKGSSTGAYFAGKIVGGPRLAPVVSPNKTIAGAVGALAAGVLLSWAHSASPLSLIGPRRAVVFGLAVAGAGIMGDLLASLLKRQADLKDSGSVLPGMGGLLDMVDDVLLTAPVAFIFLAGGELLG